MKYLAALLSVAYAWNNPHGLWEDIGFESRKVENCNMLDSSIGHYVQTMVDAENYQSGIRTVVDELKGRLASCTWNE